MNVFGWLGVHFSKQGKALWLYKRGMTRARKHDHQRAIIDYTSSIDMRASPADLRAMVLYNRALAYVAAGDDPMGVNDLNMVLTIDEASMNVKTMARQKLARLASRSEKSQA